MFAVFTGRGEQAFVVVIKHLIDFDGNKLTPFGVGMCFWFLLNLREQDQGKVR